MLTKRFEDYPQTFLDTASLAEIEQRIASRIEVNENGCHVFTGDRNVAGYGVIYASGARWMAHRVAKFIECRDVPPHLVIDHLCGNRSCVNPQHLEIVTQRENVRRALAFGDRCAAGHDMSAAAISPDGSRRVCRVCHEARRQRRLADPVKYEEIKRRNRERMRVRRAQQRALA